MYKIIYTKSFNRKAAKFIKKHPDLISQYEKTLKLLELNPFHPALQLQELTGKLEELCSISINISNRITMEFLISDKTIIPVKIGTHDEAYG